MANYDTRRVLDYRFGQLSASVTALDTTMQAAAFATLASDLSAEKYVPIIIADDALGLYEVVWLTAHSASSQSVTVVRGREGSTARAWPSGTLWRVAPTVRDVQATFATRAALPSDAHIGMRAMVEDEDVSVVRTAFGWAVPLGGHGDGRRHGWLQTGASIPAGNVDTLCTGLTAMGSNGSIATFSGGNLLLNRAGHWSLSWEVSCDWGTGNMRLAGFLRWTNGAFFPKSEIKQSAYSSSGFTGAGLAHCRASWEGYVTSAQAAQVIGCYLSMGNSTGAALSATGYHLAAEYLGG